MIGTYNTSHRKGDTWSGVVFTFDENGTPIDLTGASVNMHFRTEKTSKQVNKLSTASGEIVISNPAGGEVAVGPILIDWPACTYKYDLEITFSDGTVKTYVEGDFELIQDVTYE